MQKCFITSDGRKIDFIDGWFDAKHVWPHGIDNIKEFSEKIFCGTPKYPTGYGFFVNKLTLFNYFYELISENFTNIPKKWGRSLDIGTGSGIQPRLMKASGMCKEAYGLDIVDRSNEVSDEMVATYVRNFKNDMHQKSAQVISIIERRSIVLSNEYPIHTPYSLSSNSNYSINKYIVSDFMNYDFGNEKFDIITALWVIEYFDPDKLFQKIYSLLNPGGIFFVIVDYWYEVFGSSMNLPMDAPWLHARTTRKDLLRYYDECRPEISDYAKKCVYFVKSHLTPIDYCNKATKCRLQFVSYRRCIIPDLVIPMTIGKPEKLFYNNILPDAKIINPNVEASDLFTYYLAMIFRKE